MHLLLLEKTIVTDVVLKELNELIIHLLVAPF